MAPESFPTLRAAVEWATARLTHAGFEPEDARLDARVLARHAFGLDPAGLIVGEPAPPPRDVRPFVDAVHRRATHEPVAYITGVKEFYGREFAVSPAVLIPRPETELIVELALERLSDRTAPIEIVDVGTGSGCLAVTLALEFPRAFVVATDVSLDALRVARANARRHGVDRRIAFHHVSLVTSSGPADLIVSNPPYVADSQQPLLPSDVREFEPALALYAGADGLDVIRALVDRAAGVLDLENGWLIFEFGYGQSDEVRRLMTSHGAFADVEIRNDLQGLPRTCAARRNDYLQTVDGYTMRRGDDA